MGQTTCDVLVDRFVDWGVDTIFGLPGDAINGFMESLRTARDRIRFVHVRHEEVAALAACSYAKFTGRLGVCNQRVMGPAHIEAVADQACRAALSMRGPAHIAIPVLYQIAEVSSAKRSKRNIKGHTSEAFQPPLRVPVKSELQRAAAALRGKHKIAILVGSAARGAGEEVEQLAEKLGAPVIKAMLGKEVLPDDGPYTTGGTGVVGTRPSSEALKNCDGFSCREQIQQNTEREPLHLAEVLQMALRQDEEHPEEYEPGMDGHVGNSQAEALRRTALVGAGALVASGALAWGARSIIRSPGRSGR